MAGESAFLHYPANRLLAVVINLPGEIGRDTDKWRYGSHLQFQHILSHIIAEKDLYYLAILQGLPSLEKIEYALIRAVIINAGDNGVFGHFLNLAARHDTLFGDRIVYRAYLVFEISRVTIHAVERVHQSPTPSDHDIHGLVPCGETHPGRDPHHPWLKPQRISQHISIRSSLYALPLFLYLMGPSDEFPLHQALLKAIRKPAIKVGIHALRQSLRVVTNLGAYLAGDSAG